MEYVQTYSALYSVDDRHHLWKDLNWDLWGLWVQRVINFNWLHINKPNRSFVVFDEVSNQTFNSHLHVLLDEACKFLAFFEVRSRISFHHSQNMKAVSHKRAKHKFSLHSLHPLEVNVIVFYEIWCFDCKTLKLYLLVNFIDQHTSNNLSLWISCKKVPHDNRVINRSIFYISHCVSPVFNFCKHVRWVGCYLLYKTCWLIKSIVNLCRIGKLNSA